MGSLSPSRPSPPPPPPPPPRPSSDNSIDDYRIYASFSSQLPPPNSNLMANSIQCYNPLNNSWHRVTSIPYLNDNHARKGFSMVPLRDSIYIIGGKLCRKINTNDDVSEFDLDLDVEVLSCVLRYDISSDAWSKCASLNVPRSDFACVVRDGKIFVAGGQATVGSVRGVSSVEVYDPVEDEWRQLCNMKALRYRCVGVMWQGKIHVVGGFAEREDSDAPRWHTMERSSAEVYDYENDTWDIVVGMWQLDVPPNQIAAVDEKLFSSGDCLNSWKGHIEAFDAKLNIWNIVDGSHLQNLSSPISTSDATWPPIQRLYLTMASIGSHLYFLAGYRKPGEMSRLMSVVHVFDTSASEDGWTSFEPLEEEGEKELCSHCCVVRQVS